MIIDITRCNYARGYLPKATEGFFNPFFAAANVAIRRQTIEQVGGFDDRCGTGEDIDLSFRVSRAGWELWYEPTAIVNHQDPQTFAHLLRQWFGYGTGLPYLFRKHVGRPRLQVYRPGVTGDGPSMPYGARCVVDLPFPFYAVIFTSAWHLFHLSLVALVLAAILHLRAVFFIAAAIALLSGLAYARLRFDWRHPVRSLVMLALRYAADTAFVLGALLSGLRQGALFLQATRTR